MVRTPFDQTLPCLRTSPSARSRPIRWALQSLALLLSLLMIVPPVRADDLPCIDALVKNYSGLVKAWSKNVGSCIADADRSGLATAEACSTTDAKGKVARAVQKLMDEAVGGAKDKCGGVTPAFGYQDPSVAIQAAQDQIIGLAHDIFGDPLDLKGANGDKELAICRKVLWKGVGKITHTMAREWRSCIKTAIQNGATTNIELEQQCFLNTGPIPSSPDPKGRVAKQQQALTNKLEAHDCLQGTMLAAHSGPRPTAVEYAVMLALIIVVCLAAISLLGGLSKSTLGQANPALVDQWDDGAVNDSHLVGVKADAFVGINGGADRICKNNGSGGFNCGPANDGAQFTNAVAVGYIGNDTKLDAFIVSDSTPAGRICTDATGMSLSCVDSTGFLQAYDVALGTLDGSDLDAIIASGYVGSSAYWCQNTGAGGFYNCGVFPPGGSPETYNSWGVALADFDRNGMLDVIFANDGYRNRVCYHTDSGAPLFSSGFACADVSTDTGGNVKVAVGDLNGDKRIDAVFARRTEPNRVCLGSATGGFACSDLNSGSSGASDVAVGDIDQDGDNDVVFATGSPNRACVNDGAASFSCKDVSSDVGNWNSVHLGDVDGNGSRDAVFANSAGPSKVCLNSQGNFTCGDLEAYTGLTRDIALGNGLLVPPNTPTATPTITQTPTLTPLP